MTDLLKRLIPLLRAYLLLPTCNENIFSQVMVTLIKTDQLSIGSCDYDERFKHGEVNSESAAMW